MPSLRVVGHDALDVLQARPVASGARGGYHAERHRRAHQPRVQHQDLAVHLRRALPGRLNRLAQVRRHVDRNDRTVALDLPIHLRELGRVWLRGHRVVRRCFEQPIEFVGVQIHAVSVTRGPERHVRRDYRNPQFRCKFGRQ